MEKPSIGAEVMLTRAVYDFASGKTDMIMDNRDLVVLVWKNNCVVVYIATSRVLGSKSKWFVSFPQNTSLLSFDLVPFSFSLWKRSVDPEEVDHMDYSLTGPKKLRCDQERSGSLSQNVIEDEFPKFRGADEVIFTYYFSVF